MAEENRSARMAAGMSTAAAIAATIAWLKSRKSGEELVLPEEFVQLVVAMAATVDSVEDKVLQLKEDMMSYYPRATKTSQHRIQQTLAPLAGQRFFDTCFSDSILTSICFHFPPGCNALVDIAAGHGDQQLFPQEGFIALDAATPVFPVMESIQAGEPLWAEIRNGDAINAHTISVIFTLQAV